MRSFRRIISTRRAARRDSMTATRETEGDAVGGRRGGREAQNKYAGFLTRRSRERSSVAGALERLRERHFSPSCWRFFCFPCRSLTARFNCAGMWYLREIVSSRVDTMTTHEYCPLAPRRLFHWTVATFISNFFHSITVRSQRREEKDRHPPRIARRIYK